MKILILFLTIIFLNIKVNAEVVMLDAPKVESKSTILIDFNTGEILQKKNIHEKLPIASLTKVMTAYVVFYEIKRGTISLKDKIKVSKNAWQKEGSKMFIEVGKEVTIEDLIKGLIVQSGNDAAITLAEAIAGTEKDFADLMNKHAKILGMNNSNFKNSTGLHNKDHYSSAYDLSLLGRKIIIDFPDFYKYFSIPSFQYNNIYQKNRNKLIHLNKNKYDGFKTGYTSQAKYCLLASAKHSERRVIGVILGSDTVVERFDEAESILDYGLKNFENFELKIKNTEKYFMKIPTNYMEKDFLNVKLNGYFIKTLPKGSINYLKIDVNLPNFIDYEVKKDEKIGEVNIFLKNEKIANIDIISMDNIKKSKGIEYIIDYITLNFLKKGFL